MAEKTVTTPQQIIQAFDDCLDFVFGRSRGRDYAAKEDEAYARAWIEEGLTVNVACFCFYHRMNSMHEFWLRQIDHHDKKNIPATLKFFDENIRSAIARWKAGGEPIAAWEQSESQWTARIRSFFLKGFWLDDMWGPSPGQPGCRAPKRLIEEQKAKEDRIIK